MTLAASRDDRGAGRRGAAAGAAVTAPTSCCSGEPGTGKEGLARALHQLTCPDGPLVRFDVAGFSDEDALAALVGTGGGKRRGAAEAARGGTLLIEEAAGSGRARRRR